MKIEESEGNYEDSLRGWSGHVRMGGQGQSTGSV